MGRGANVSLRKALDSVTGSALIPEDLEPVLVEMLYQLSPLANLLEKKQADGKTHEIARRSGSSNFTPWFEGELTSTPSGYGTYSRDTVQIKILRTGGGVSGFQQAASKAFIDALEAEQRGAVETMADLIEFGCLWGDAAADAYQFSGFNKFISTNRLASYGTTVTLTHLDDLIDACTAYRGVQADQKLFLMSPQMNSKISGLQTKVQRTINTVKFEGGLEMESYRDIPIYKSSLCRPASAASPSAFTGAAAGAAEGDVATDTYYFRVAAVLSTGEQIAAAEQSVAADANDKITLSWTAVSGAKLYKIYVGLASGTHYLLTSIPAITYTAAGAVSDYVDGFTWGLAAASCPETKPGNTQALLPTPTSGDQPLDTGEENIFLINLNPDRGSSLLSLNSDMGEQMDQILRYIELARTRSAYDFLLEAFLALQVPWESLHGVYRGLKTT